MIDYRQIGRRRLCAMALALTLMAPATSLAQANDEEKRRLEGEADKRREERKERREKALDLERSRDAERRAREDLRREERQRDSEELRRER